MRQPRPLIDPEKKLIVLWSPKSACTMTYIWFANVCGFSADMRTWSNPHEHRVFEYMKSERYERAVKKDTSDFEVIKILRDPYSRAVSIFRHAIRRPFLDKDLQTWSGQKCDPENGISFDQFLDFVGTLDVRCCNPHMRLQIHPFEEEGRRADIVINLSKKNLFAELDAIARERDWPETRFEEQSWVHELSSSRRAEEAEAGGPLDQMLLTRIEHGSRFPSYSRVLTERTRQKIEAIYAADFEFYREFL